jgi:signal transduction histidine kinase
MVEQVNYDADRVTRLITELLDVSRLESGRLKLRPEWIQLSEMVDKIVVKLAFAHPEAAVQTRFSAEFPQVYADRDKVEQVLTNLIENAAKYGDPETIEVEGRAVDGVVAVAVSDRGEGLAPEVLPRIFTKFYRAENRAGRPTGTGLGLYIARGLAEAHGGSLHATSALGVGSTFTLSLPQAPDSAPTEPTR